MAFKMNRPVIKGTANHKASIAKAKSESIVAQTRTQADTGLITAADAVGQSFSPKEIEYGTSMDAFKVPKKDDKKKAGKKKNKKEKTRKERIREEYDREHPSGTLFPNDDGGYQYYDADGKLVSKKVYDKDGNEVKKEKSKTGEKIVDGVKTAIGGIVGVPLVIGKGLFKFGEDIIDEFGNKVEGAIEDITKSAEESKKNREKTKAEREAAKLEADKLKQAELDKKEIEKALALERRNEEKLKKRLIREEAAERRRNRNKKGKIEVGEVKTTGIGDQQINQQTRQYTKEQRERLDTGEEGGNVWSKEEERYVLPEEIVDGEFVSKAEGETIIVSPNIKGKTTEPVVEEKKTTTTTPTEKPKPSDFRTKKNAFGGTLTAQQQYKDALKEYYSKSPMDMRDNRIYRNAIKGGVVQQNMIKSGYIPE